MTTQTPFTADSIQIVYIARRDRRIHPVGTFDNAGRWYPSDAEDCGVSNSHRSPSRSYPYSYMTACRSRRHVAALAAQSPALFAAELVRASSAIARTQESDGLAA